MQFQSVSEPGISNLTVSERHIGNVTFSDVLASVGAPPLDTATIAYKAITALVTNYSMNLQIKLQK